MKRKALSKRASGLGNLSACAQGDAVAYKPIKKRTLSKGWGIWTKICGLLLGQLFSLQVIAQSTLDIRTDIKEISAYQVFDHIETGFPLTGNHEHLSCISCHSNGRYEKLPRRCDACHNNDAAPGLPNGHVITAAPCDICHTTLGFIEQIDMDHRSSTARCVNCHNGMTQVGKSASHVATTDECGDCHSTVAWVPVGLVDHEQIMPGSCIVCHDNVIAKGKNPVAHISSSNECEACHQIQRGTWVVTNLDHTHTRGQCESCHNQLIASGPDRRHQLTSVSCDSCHNVVNWNIVFFNHSGLTTQQCSACHDGQMTSGKPANHVVSSQRCETCHQAGISWQVVTRFDHNESAGACHQCHQPGASHIAVIEQCDKCHVTEAWSILMVRHGEIISVQCESCHNGRITAGVPQRHCSSDHHCERCHATHTWQTDSKCDAGSGHHDEHDEH